MRAELLVVLLAASALAAPAPTSLQTGLQTLDGARRAASLSVTHMKTAAHRCAACLTPPTSGTASRTTSTSSRAPCATCAAPGARRASPAHRVAHRACASPRPARPTSRVSATST